MALIRTVSLLFSSFSLALHIPAVTWDQNLTARAGIFTYEPIDTGYVAFGDSYAAGVGAGPTSGDGCRVGANSYPNQLNTWVSSLQPGVDYQNLPCSGAVLSDLLQGNDKSQIDKWTNPSRADRATLSIGGNDVGFFDVLNACVLRVQQSASGTCDIEIAKAYDIIHSFNFNSDLDKALRQILAKSGRDDFHIIQTGYPAFFNVDTDSCDYTTFYFWQPGHHGFHHAGNWAYLSKDLRKKLNALVIDLNRQFITVIDGVNQDYLEPRVTFADPNPAFDGHRFCEEGVTEPDPNHESTWFFLASWPDYSTTTGAQVQDTEEEDQGTLIPDAADCAASHDWSDLILCGMGAAGIAYNGEDGLRFALEIELPDGTNVSTSEISYWKPTKWVKTFHPRSTGHLSYRDLVRWTW